MLTGEELGRAIRAAIEMKGVSQKTVAAHFGVKPPSIQDWMKRGVIGKNKLPELWRYFSDVAGPAHWGLREWPAAPAAEDVGAGGDCPWPFERVTPEQWAQLTPEERSGVEGYIAGLLAGSRRKSPRKKAA